MEAALQSKNIHQLCRLCLDDNFILQDLFASFAPDFNQDSMLLIEKITESTSIKIMAADELPTKVCHQCCEQVEEIHKFKQKCLAADSLLRKYVRHKLQQKEACEQGTSLPSLDCGSTVSEVDSFLKEDANVDASTGTEYVLLPDMIEDDLLKYDSEMLLEVNIKEEEEELSNDCSNSYNEEVLSSNMILTSSKMRINSSKSKSKMVPNSSKYFCQLCGKNFCNKYSLTRHKWSHSKKTTSCQYCNKIFKNRESGLRHEKMHQEGNRYRCHMCDKSYVSSTSHAAHVRKHTGERPFKCSDCDLTFYLISSFERHVAKHRGVKDYQCEICSAAFWVPDDLRAHVNRMH